MGNKNSVDATQNDPQREPPAHESNRLWLLDLSPDQVHDLPLLGILVEGRQ